MSATLILDLDPEILREAEMEARSRNTTLASIVAGQLGIMSLNWKESQCGNTPLTDFLRGSVHLPADYNLKGDYRLSHLSVQTPEEFLAESV